MSVLLIALLILALGGFGWGANGYYSGGYNGGLGMGLGGLLVVILVVLLATGRL